MSHYRARRSWIIAEGLLGYIAFLVGLSGSGLIFGGRLAMRLEANGDDVVWGIFFMSAGAGMVLISAALALVRRCQDDRVAGVLSTLRTDLHVLLSCAWAYGLYTVFTLEHLSVIFISLAPAMIAYHIVGAWEHTKERYLGADAKYHGLYDRISRGGFRG